MDALVFLIPVSLLLGGVGLAGFLWALRSRQYEDLDGAAARILLEVIDGDSPEPAVVEAATPVWRDSIAPTRARRP